MRKIEKKLWDQRKARIRQIMDAYSLTYADIMRLVDVNYDKVKNWRDGMAFFTIQQEYSLLQQVKRHYIEFTRQIDAELACLQPDPDKK